MSETLLPCPFCGAQAKTIHLGNGLCFAGCTSCAATSGDSSSKSVAIAAWNHRVPLFSDNIKSVEPYSREKHGDVDK